MIDFHCHIDLFKDPENLVRTLAQHRMYVLSVTTTPKAFLQTERLSQDYTRIRTALGLHPQLVKERYNELSIFEMLLDQASYVGEVGLDGGKENKESQTIQKAAFDTILRFCSERNGRIISIHSRRAATEVLESLNRSPDCGIPVLHWFSGSHDELKIAIERGCWFSVGEPMVRSKKGVEIIKRIPSGRVLPESDAPFASSNVSRSIDRTIQGLASIWGTNHAGASANVAQNLRKLIAG